MTTQVVTARDRVRGVALPRAAILQFGLAIGLVLLPLLLAPLPPLTDYPNHLARLGILRDVLGQGPASPWYELSSLAVPNLLSDVAILLLAHLVSLEQAVRIVLGLALLLPLLGVAALQRVLFGRISPAMVLGAAVTVLGLPVLMGFLNYVLAVGILLLGTAAWIAAAERPWPVRLLLGCSIALVLFACHIVALALYGAVVAGYELQRVLPNLRRAPLPALGRLAVGAAAFVPPAALFLLASPTRQVAGGTIDYDLPKKLASIPATLATGTPVGDVATAVLICVALPLVIVLARTRPVIARPLRLALLLAGALFLLLPSDAGGTAANLDQRLPWAIILLGLGATRLEPLRYRRLPVMLGLAIGLGCIGLRGAAIAADWAGGSRNLAVYRAAFALLPEGSMLVSAVERGLSKGALVRQQIATDKVSTRRVVFDLDIGPSGLFTAFARQIRKLHAKRAAPPNHAAALAALDGRRFVPQIFADPGLQPVVVRARLLPVKMLQLNDPVPVTSAAQLAETVTAFRDAAGASGWTAPIYLLLLSERELGLDPPAGVVPVASGPRFRLFRFAAPAG